MLSQAYRPSFRFMQTSRPAKLATKLLVTSALIGTGVSLVFPVTVFAQSNVDRAAALHNFNIQAQSLAGALNNFGRQTGLQISAPASATQGLSSQAVSGSLTPSAALSRLLKDTGLAFTISSDGTVYITPQQQSSAGGEPAVAGTVALDMITVTAGGFAQSVVEAPASITVIPREELEKKPYRSLIDAARHVEGVTMIGGDDGDISIRGMPGSGTLILVDGRRQNSTRELNPKSGNSVEDNWMPPVGAVERIEVVRGPMSSRYGSDAMGGVINIITRKVADKWTGSLGADMTVQGNSRSGNSHQGDFYLNGPLVADTLGLQVWGYKKTRKEDEIVGGFNEEDNLNGTARLWFTPTENHDFMLEAHRSRQRYWAEPGMSISEKSQDFYRDYKRESYTFAHTGRWDLGTSQLSYSYDEASRDAYTADVADSWMPGISNHTVDGSFVAPVGENHMLSVGGQWRRQILDIGGMRNGQLPPLPDGTPATGQLVAEVDQWALFVEDEWSVFDSFSLTGGLRYDNNSIFGDQLSPRLYANWQPTENWAIKGGVATGFVAPTMKEYVPYIGNGQRGGATTWGNPDLKPETSLNKEIGIYYDNLDNFTANATYFHTNYKNKIANSGSRCLDAPSGQPVTDKGCWAGPDGRPMSVYFNVPEAVIQGVELATRWGFAEDWALSGTYTYTKSNLKTAGVNIYGFPLSQTDGLAPVSTPRHVVSAKLDWQAREELSTFVRANYRSKDNQGVSWGGGSNPMNESAGDLLTFDAGLSWQINDHFTVNAAVYNITNKTNYDAERTGSYQYIEDGRRFWLGARTSF